MTSDSPARPASSTSTRRGSASAVPDVAGVRTNPRDPRRRRAAPLAKIAMVCFFIGGLAVLADLILFASGARDLPLWLNLTALLAPIGLGIGLVGVIVENRKSAAEARALSADQ